MSSSGGGVYECNDRIKKEQIYCFLFLTLILNSLTAALDKEKTPVKCRKPCSQLCAHSSTWTEYCSVSSAKTNKGQTKRWCEECTYFSFISRHQISSSMESPWTRERWQTKTHFSTQTLSLQTSH